MYDATIGSFIGFLITVFLYEIDSKQYRLASKIGIVLALHIILLWGLPEYTIV